MMHRRSRSTLLAAAPVLAALLTGCGALRPPGIPPVPSMPRFGEAGGATTPAQSCTPFIASAHAALATVGTDPAAAHTGYAMAIHQYHSCLAIETSR
jgi:hypothetical protein